MYLVIYLEDSELKYKQFNTREQVEEYTKELVDANTKFLAFNTLSVLIMKG